MRLGPDFRISDCDFRHLGDRIRPGSIDLAVCDPPWITDFAHLRQPFAEAVAALLRPGAFLACYTGIPHVAAFLDHLRGAGLAYRWMVSAGHRQASVRHSSSIRSQWSPILILQKPGPTGDRWTTRNDFGDVFLDQQRDKSMHAWQQPIEEAVALVEGLSGPGAVVADPFVCSRTVPAAAAMVGEGRKFVGCEADAKLAKAARYRVAQILGGRRVDAGLATALGWLRVRVRRPSSSVSFRGRSSPPLSFHSTSSSSRQVHGSRRHHRIVLRRGNPLDLAQRPVPMALKL